MNDDNQHQTTTDLQKLQALQRAAYVQCYAWALSYGMGIGLSEHDAKDEYQNAVEGAMRTYNPLHTSGASFRTHLGNWVTGTMKKAAKKAAARPCAPEPHVHPYDSDTESSFPPPTESPAGPDTDPDVLHRIREVKEGVQNILRRLSSKEAARLLMRHNGHEWTEIDEANGLRPGVSRQLVRRTEGKLRKISNGEDETGQRLRELWQQSLDARAQPYVNHQPARAQPYVNHQPELSGGTYEDME